MYGEENGEVPDCGWSRPSLQRRKVCHAYSGHHRGTTGIGRATAELLHARSYQVAVTGQNPESLARAQSELPDDVLVVRSDGRVLSDIDALMSAVSARFGSLDLLFLNAGIFRPAPVAEVTEESFDEHADLNFKGQYFTLQKALPLMNDGGSIVLTVGIGSRRGTPGATVGRRHAARCWPCCPRSRSN
ncbi:SDR family oxidoreductase [Streptomyces sp. SudanB182_2057]|uniref:SDR family oxidoreductase n=1 Tax=Streptomyces sp. SudanB182_2057 TaxID=3035281 RepID=UPI003F546A19